jgi:hypothetical protein
MLVTDQIRKLVVFVGHHGIRDPLAPDEDKFIPDGTGFVLILEAHGFTFPYVVQTPSGQLSLRFVCNQAWNRCSDLGLWPRAIRPHKVVFVWQGA